MNANISTHTLKTGDTTFYQFNAQLGFWGVPNLKHNVFFPQQPDAPILVEHNADGNRDIDICLIPDQKSIVCLGGSHTWGGGVEQTIRYSERLAQLTQRQVYNLGHCSIGLDQVCLAVLGMCAKYNPEIIIIEQYPWAIHRILNNYINGYVRPHFYLDARLEARLRKVPYVARHRLIRRIIGAYYAFRKEFLEYRGGINLKDDYDSKIDPMFLLWKTRHYDPMYALVDKILVVIRDYCTQNNIKLLFGLGAIQQKLTLHSKSSVVDYDLPRDRLIEILIRNGVAYVDMTSSMLAEHSDKAPVIFKDGHINAKGHDVFARALHSDMLVRGWLK